MQVFENVEDCLCEKYLRNDNVILQNFVILKHFCLVSFHPSPLKKDTYYVKRNNPASILL